MQSYESIIHKLGVNVNKNILQFRLFETNNPKHDFYYEKRLDYDKIIMKEVMELLILTITWNIWYTLGIILVALAAPYFTISYIIYKKMMLDYNNPPVDLVDHTEDFYKDAYQWFQEIPKEDVSISSYDSLKLHGYYIPSFDKKSTNLAIVVHGYQSKATDMIIIGQMYSKMGFQVILTDLRGHGDSEGNFTTFGHYEKYDLKRWINYAVRNYGQDLKILVHGVSMGAASAMMVTGLDVPKNLSFMVLDSGFTKAIRTFANVHSKFFFYTFYFGLNIVTYIKHKFLVEQIKPIKYMRKNEIPFLIVQGDKDIAVPVSMAKHLYNVSPANKKDILIIENSKHALGFRDDFKKCEDTVRKNIQEIFKIKKTYTINT